MVVCELLNQDVLNSNQMNLLQMHNKKLPLFGMHECINDGSLVWYNVSMYNFRCLTVISVIYSHISFCKN